MIKIAKTNLVNDPYNKLNTVADRIRNAYFVFKKVFLHALR